LASIKEISGVDVKDLNESSNSFRHHKKSQNPDELCDTLKQEFKGMGFT